MNDYVFSAFGKDRFGVRDLFAVIDTMGCAIGIRVRFD